MTFDRVKKQVKCCEVRDRNDRHVLKAGTATKLRHRQPYINTTEEEDWDNQEKDRHFSWRCHKFLNPIREEEEEEE
jgi:hypothetical protein